MPDMTEPALTTHYPCNVCAEPAIACLRPDMDIKGLCFCAEHEEQVRAAYTMLMTGDMDTEVNKVMKDWKYR